MKLAEKEEAEAGWKPGQYFDTVEIPLPIEYGADFALFRDLADKSEALTNFRKQRSLSFGDSLKVREVIVETQRWSGDDMTELLFLLGNIRLKVNDRKIFESPLRQVRYGTTKIEEFHVVDNDDLSGRIEIGRTPWPMPELTEWVEKQEVTDEVFHLPSPFNRLIGPSVLKRSRTFSAPVSRPKKGSVLVTVYLKGMLREPVR